MSTTCTKDFALVVDPAPTTLTPCDLSEPDNTILGSIAIGDITILNSTASYGATLQPMNFNLEDMGGCYTYETVVGGGCGATSNTLTKGGHELVSTPVVGIPVSTQLTQTGTDQPEFLPAGGCPPNPSYDCANIVGDTVLNSFHGGGDLSLKFTGWGGYGATTRANGGPNPTWQLRRVAKPIVPVPDRLRVTAISWAAVAPLLVPLPGAGAGGAAPIYDGTMPVFSIGPLSTNWMWQFNGGQLFTKALTDAELYHTTWEPLSPTTCAWICGFGYSSGGSWAGMGGGGGTGGGGLYPHGRFYFNPGLFSFGVDGQYADVRVATTTALPANTRVLNVITANGNGALPSIDGVTLALNDRVLIKNEAAGANHGVYTVTDLGSPVSQWVFTRATDMDISAEVTQGIFVKITAGSTLTGSYWRQVTLDPITLNTTVLNWLQIPAYIDIESY